VAGKHDRDLPSVAVIDKGCDRFHVAEFRKRRNERRLAPSVGGRFSSTRNPTFRFLGSDDAISCRIAWNIALIGSRISSPTHPTCGLAGHTQCEANLGSLADCIPICREPTIGPCFGSLNLYRQSRNWRRRFVESLRFCAKEMTRH